MQCSSTTFRLGTGISGSATWATSNIGSNCAEDYIGIEGKYVSAMYNIISFVVSESIKFFNIL